MVWTLSCLSCTPILAAEDVAETAAIGKRNWTSVADLEIGYGESGNEWSCIE